MGPPIELIAATNRSVSMSGWCLGPAEHGDESTTGGEAVVVEALAFAEECDRFANVGGVRLQLCVLLTPSTLCPIFTAVRRS